ncbi:50S ribosomal protein L21 [bacterium]|nr:50S ribosomal protein L21 [bacterium]
MDALIDLGGTQVRVKKGLEFTILKLKDKKVGEKVEFTPICILDDKDSIIVEEEKLKNFLVQCEIISEKKGKKIYSFKKKAKTGYKRGIGYRDSLMVLKVENIVQK